MHTEGGAAAKGGGDMPPKHVGGAPNLLRFPTLGALGPWGAHQPTKGQVPTQLQPIRSFGAGGPSRWTPGTPSVVPIQYR